MAISKSSISMEALIEENLGLIEAYENPDPSRPLIQRSKLPVPVITREIVSKRCCTKSRMLLLMTSLVSITVVLLVQCLFWNFSPLMKVCCGGQISGGSSIAQGNMGVMGEGVRGGAVEGGEENYKVTVEQPEMSRQAEVEYRKGLSKKWRKSKQRDNNEKEKIDDERKQRFPQCIIIGVRKGGTRALLEFLNLHPQIAAHRVEIHFFDNDENYSQGLEWYRTSMPRSSSDQVTMEKTPAYFVSESVPERISAMNRSIKLLLIVRDPVERAISDYHQIREQKHRHDKLQVSFEELAIREDNGKVNEGYSAVRRGIYHRFMSRWLRLFPLNQIHLVSGEQLVKDPLPELRKVEEFLGLPPLLNEDMFYLNKTRGFYCMRNVNGHQERCLARSKGREHPYVSPEVIEKLRHFYRPHNEKFYRMVGIDFGWP